MLSVLVVAVSVAPVATLTVCAAVDRPRVISPVPDVPPAVQVLVVALVPNEMLEELVPLKVTELVAVNEVNAPVFVVVAPTVPLCAPENVDVSVVPSNVMLAESANKPAVVA
jgi:hypothetical protein